MRPDDLLLERPNPIVETAKPGRHANAFIHRITWEGGMYPDPDKGIRLHAGDELNLEQLLNFSIPETVSPLRRLEDRLKRENFHTVEDAMVKLVARIEADIEFEVSKDSLWYRGRIGVAWDGLGMPHGEVVRIATPYGGRAIGARLPPDATAGRTNRAGGNSTASRPSDLCGRLPRGKKPPGRALRPPDPELLVIGRPPRSFHPHLSHRLAAQLSNHSGRTAPLCRHAASLGRTHPPRVRRRDVSKLGRNRQKSLRI